MTFRKTVLAYLTGWLIVQPIYNRIYIWWRNRELANPGPALRASYRDLASAVVDEMADRFHLARIPGRYDREDVLKLVEMARRAGPFRKGEDPGEWAAQCVAAFDGSADG